MVVTNTSGNAQGGHNIITNVGLVSLHVSQSS